MRPKAIRDLIQLSDKDFLSQIAVGYEKVLSNAMIIDKDAEVMRENKLPNGCRILSGIAEEEAAKCLILLDAVHHPE